MKTTKFRVKDYLDSPAMKRAYYREIILDRVKLYFRPITWIWKKIKGKEE